LTLYKWLDANGKTPTKGFVWPYEVGEWAPDAKPVLCESGWHGMEEKDVLSHLPGDNAGLYEVEVRGDVVHGEDKLTATSMRLVRLVGFADPRTLRAFALINAESVLPIFEKKCPNDSRVRDCIEVGWKFTRGLATRDELEAAQAAEEALEAGETAWAATGAALWYDGYAARLAARAAAWAATSPALLAAMGAAEATSGWVSAGNAAAKAVGNAFRAESSSLLVHMIETGVFREVNDKAQA
jgi:hypothetical protein